MIPKESLTNAHPKKFVCRKNPKPTICRNSSSFQQELGKIGPQGQEILSVVKGHVIPFLKVPVQRPIPKQVAISKTQKLLIDQKIMEMLDKGAMLHKKVHQFPNQFLTNSLLVKKKDGGNRTCINLKALNNFIPYKDFKMEGLHCLKYLLEENDFFCKIDLKDVYFSVPQCMSSRKFVRFA